MWKRLFSECSPGKRRFPGKSYKNEGLEKMKNAERKFRMPMFFIQDGSGGGDSFPRLNLSGDLNVSYTRTSGRRHRRAQLRRGDSDPPFSPEYIPESRH